MVVSNNRLELSFDNKTGALRQIRDLQKDTILAQNDLNEAFYLEYEQNVFSSEFKSFSGIQEDNGIRLCWELENEITVYARVFIGDEKYIAFHANVENKGKRIVHSLEYPLIDGLKSFEGEKDYVAHSYATGFLVENPLENFEKDYDGFRHMPYPESFSGASMQFFTYYAKGRGGLYFAADDGSFYHKWLNFYKYHGALRASHIFGYEDVGAGKHLKMEWNFLLQATEGDDWYEACDIYKKWALKQSWCARGKLRELSADKKADWLIEDMGASTFGINGMYDRTRWIRKYHETTETPIFHVTGPDWPRVPQTYGSGIPGGYEDWFPTCFNQENIEAWKALGDRFAPFEFDFLIDTQKGDSARVVQNLQKWPEKPKSMDAYAFHMLCPICNYTKELHRERDRRVVKESGADAMYYDISANNILKTCMSEAHGHPLGAGRLMTEAYRDIYRNTKEVLAEDSGRYVPLGTEMMNETFLDVLDFYQARANAQPCSALETWFFRKQILDNKAWVVPMFQYVYSGYGPLRLDGWGKVAAEGGDLIYHTIAKTYLWGGLFEINSEYSPMEVIDETGENSSEEHYCKLEPRNFFFDEEIGAYLKKFAALRVGRYGKFLSYGEMKRPPVIKCEKAERSFFQYNHSNSMETNSKGCIARESIIAQTYELEGETVVFLANTTALQQKIQLTIPQAESGVLGICWDYLSDKSEEVAEKTVASRLLLQPYQLVVVRIGK